MEFVTIHDLARELNIPERVIRYRLLNLIAEGKLKEHDDFRRDEFKDDHHFVWKIHPLRFMSETGLKPAKSLLPTDNNVDNKVPPVVNPPVNSPTPTVNEPPRVVTKPDTNVDNKPADASLARELIDVLKDQVRVKDEQLRVKDEQLSDLGEQLKENQELSIKLTGAMLQQAQEIKDLLRLTDGRTETVSKDPAAANKIVNESIDSVTSVVNESSTNGYQTANNEGQRQAA